MSDNSILTLLPKKVVDSDESLVAAALYVQAGEPSHAALIIRHNGTIQAFHLYGSVLLEIPQMLEEDQLLIFIKELDFIPPMLVPSFLAHCELIKDQAKPVHGFFYDPRSYYDLSGKFQNAGSFPEYLTCVGFCLTVIQSYLIEDQYLHYDDWDHTTLDVDPTRTANQMLNIQRNYPDLKPEDLKKAVRRILPIEYFSAGYANKIPVRKNFTDRQIIVVKDEISRKVA